jgi:hypothetical protein
MAFSFLQGAAEREAERALEASKALEVERERCEREAR